MKRIAAVILSSILVSFCLLALSSCDVDWAKHYTVLDDGTYCLRFPDDSMKSGDVVIPSVYKDKPVTKIGYQAFCQCENITSITVPACIKEIESGAFYRCGNLAEVIFENGVEIIGSDSDSVKGVFEGCTSLKSVKLPESLRFIGCYTFKDCAELCEIDLPDGLERICGQTFSSCKKLTTVTIPKTVTYIGSKAFEGCELIKDVYLPDGLKELGKEAFAGCENLNYNEYKDAFYIGNRNNPYIAMIRLSEDIEELSINENTKIIWENALSSLPESIKDIYYPEGVVTIEDQDYCQSISVPNSVEIFRHEVYYYYDFQYNEYENGLYVGNETNPYLIFIKCKDASVTEVKINENTVHIGPKAFINCSIKQIDIPEGVVYIQYEAFSHADIEIYNLPISIKTIAPMNEYTKKINYAGTKEDWAKVDGSDYINKKWGELIEFNK